MTEVARLLRWFDDGILLRPADGAANIIDLSEIVAAACGATVLGRTNAAQAQIRGRIGTSEHIVFVLVDGFGANLLDRLQPGSFFQQHLAMELQTVFPSSTAPCLTSIATARWPSSHGVPGWFMYLDGPQRSILTLPFVERETNADARGLGITSADVFTTKPKTAQFQRSTHWVMPKNLVNSAFTTYSAGGAAQVAYDTLDLAVERIKHIVAEAARPTYTYWYIPDVDYVEHVRGASHKEVAKTLTRVERAAASLAEHLEGRARIIVTADHGQIDIPVEQLHVLKPGDPLLRHLVAPPACEPRVPAFHVTPNAFDDFASEFRARFGKTWALLTVDEVDELRLFGPERLSPITRRRLGNFLALNATHEMIMTPSKGAPLLGSHGGLLPDEMLVPLIIV